MALTLGMVLVYVAAEVIGGVLLGSLALLADAGHMLSGAAALALTLLSTQDRAERRPRSAAAAITVPRLLLHSSTSRRWVAIAMFIMVEVVERFLDLPDVAGPLMLAVATVVSH